MEGGIEDLHITHALPEPSSRPVTVGRLLDTARDAVAYETPARVRSAKMSRAHTKPRFALPRDSQPGEPLPQGGTIAGRVPEAPNARGCPRESMASPAPAGVVSDAPQRAQFAPSSRGHIPRVHPLEGLTARSAQIGMNEE